ncbi:hypothetical protein CO641_14565 [Lysobacteraceae bacterium NML91-0213]|nr:hypothetical protein CO641_14565 [Xanthomonadaceae bacterium NML91-0213]
MASALSIASRARRAALASAALIALAGCREPEHEPPGTPPEPQAGQLRDAIQDPLDRAQAVEGALQEADARRRDQLADTP